MSGKVIGEFVCDSIKDFGMGYDGKYSGIDNIYTKSCLDEQEMYDYIGESYGFGWHIFDLVIYDKPKELREFMKPCINDHNCGGLCKAQEPLSDKCMKTMSKPPQSWCYVEYLS